MFYRVITQMSFRKSFAFIFLKNLFSPFFVKFSFSVLYNFIFHVINQDHIVKWRTSNPSREKIKSFTFSISTLWRVHPSNQCNLGIIWWRHIPSFQWTLGQEFFSDSHHGHTNRYNFKYFWAKLNSRSINLHISISLQSNSIQSTSQKHSNMQIPTI